jgi:hypothetical protein
MLSPKKNNLALRDRGLSVGLSLILRLMIDQGNTSLLLLAGFVNQLRNLGRFPHWLHEHNAAGVQVVSRQNSARPQNQ